LSQIVAAVAKL